jgi:Tfp pilus assembly protein PilN
MNTNEREIQKILERNAGKHMLFYIIVIVTVAVCVLRAAISEHREMIEHKNKQIRQLQKEIIFLDAQLRRYKG